MIAWGVETLIATSLLMLLVLAIRTPVRRAFGPAVAYALWLVPAVRMLLPPLPEAWRGAALPALPAVQDIVIYVGEPVATLPAEPAGGVGWPAVVIGLWIAGAAGFALYHIVAHGRFVARVRRRAQSVRRVAGGRVEVIESDAASGPLAFGVLRKYVAFPRDFAERYDALEQDLALAHELGHHARGDLIANWIALGMLALHWFNPIAWRAFRAFRADQEMACDALVLSGRARALRQAYGRAIVKSAHGGAVSAACHLHTINEIKGRLRMLGVHEKTSRTRLLAGAGALGALLLGGLGITASGTAAAEKVRTSVETATGVELASIALPSLDQIQPAPPAPPVPPVPAAPRAGAPDVPPPPPAPPVPPAGEGKTTRVVIMTKDGRTQLFQDGKPGETIGRVETRNFVFRDKDGKETRWSGKAGDMPEEIRIRLRDMPQISSRTCGDGEGKPGEHVIRSNDNGKKVTIICTNRITRSGSQGNMTAMLAHGEAMRAHNEAMRASGEAMRAQREAMRINGNTIFIERDARRSALSGLQGARRNIEGNRDMTDSQKRNALQGIDQAIRELQSQQKD